MSVAQRDFGTRRLEAADVKKAVDILDVLDYFGARFNIEHVGRRKWQEEVPVFCPFCEDRDSRKPAGRVDMLKQLYFCYACGAGGDVLSLAALREGDHTFREDMDWLMGEFG